VPKVTRPTKPADYRPISVTAILCRQLEKFIVHRFFHPFLLDPELNQEFSDQYAFRPTGSTTAAVTALLTDLMELLQENQYVHLIALDLTKAFDMVRHSSLAEQLAELPIPDFIYNWEIAFLEDREHCTKFKESISPLIRINASIVQGSGTGPANFITLISKLKPVNQGNRILKYADDSYLMIPACNAYTVTEELDHVGKWADSCNLKLNHNKTHEMLIRTRRRGVGHEIIPVLPGVSRVVEMPVLGVTITENLSFGKHIDRICCRARQSVYALRVLRAHGLTGPKLFDVVRATTLARMLYASPAWWGFASQHYKNMLKSIVKKLIRLGYLPAGAPTFDQLCRKADVGLFTGVLKNPGHVLHKLLPPKKFKPYTLRPRSHDRILTPLDNNLRKNFIGRMLFSF
jgi:hypothetical protein